MADQAEWTVVSERRSNGPFASLRALWTTCGHKKMYSVYDRPPFPILIDKPTPRDLIGSWQFSDFFMLSSVYGGGCLYAYMASRPFTTMAARLVVYHGVSHLFFIVAASMSLVIIPFRRLTGFWENGTRWRVPEDKLKKYDLTSHYEKATGWSKYRIHSD